MALKLLQPGVQPLGQYDGLDTEVLTLKGGEVVTFTSVVATSATDKAAKDVFDGYVSPNKRPVITRNVATAARPLMLSDEGISGYGTLFGSVVGGTVGQVSTGGAVLGPHTATGSGKVTCWDKPGLYAVSLDACDTASADGLQPTNSTLATGAGLTWVPAATDGGQLTPVGSTAAAGNTVVVGRFISFETNGSLVTTSNNMVAALNPPDGALGTTTKSYAFAVFYFSPAL
jgi:hypothetical protein